MKPDLPIHDKSVLGKVDRCGVVYCCLVVVDGQKDHWFGANVLRDKRFSLSDALLKVRRMDGSFHGSSAFLARFLVDGHTGQTPLLDALYYING